MTDASGPQTRRPARTWGQVRATARRYPTSTFFVLTFLITWGVWLPRILAPNSVAGTLALFGTYGPAMAAVIVAALIGNLRDLGARLVRWRVGWHWYAVALLGPAAFYAVLLALDVALGSPDDLVQPDVFRVVSGVVPFFVILLLTDGLGEETGWRGFALPRMLDRTGPLPASLLLGVVWATWHLPLFWTVGNPNYGGSFLIMLVSLPAMSVLYTWLFQHTAGSALIAILLHASGSWWYLLAISATAADTVRSDLAGLLLKWLLAGLVAVSWLRKARAARVSPTPTDWVRHDHT
jgi:uncharacterized protein